MRGGGALGAAGSVGAIGLVGVAGSVGAIGVVGATGNTGRVGATGLVGAVGSTDPTSGYETVISNLQSKLSLMTSNSTATKISGNLYITEPLLIPIQKSEYSTSIISSRS